MRSADQIEQDLDIARSDLESSLEELKDVIQEKVDVKAHARRAIDRVKARVSDAADRGMHKVALLYCRAEAKVRERPDIVTGALLGLAAVATLGIYIALRVRRSHRLRMRRSHRLIEERRSWRPPQLTANC